MTGFGRVLFSGSRFIFWSLIPFLLAFAVVVPWAIEEWTLFGMVLVVFMEVAVLSLMLGLYDPIRFRWALRVLTGIVFIAYLSYLMDTWILSGKELELMGSRAGASPRNALLGLVLIGLPSLFFTLKGRWKSESPPESPTRNERFN